jgi:hypothetical protein
MGVVLVVLFEVVRQPGNWTWLTEMNRPRARRVEPQAPRAKLGSEPLPPGVVRIEAAVEAVPATSSPRPPTGDVPLTIPADLVALIDHEYHVIRPSELPVIARMLAAARASTPSRLEQAARREATFTELANDPERYAGGLYRFDAEIRRCEPFAFPVSEGPPETLYEAWAFTETGGRKNPYRILCTDLPAGFPVGDAVRARVNVTAYFVKQYAYVTAHGPHVAPMFVARRFRWSKPPQKLSEEVGAAPVLTFVLAGAAVSLAILAWRLSATKSTVSGRALAATLPTPETLGNIGDGPATAGEPAVEEFLRTLAQKPPE